MSRVRLREARATDAATIADVHAASIRELGPEAYDDRQVRAWRSNVDPERYPLEEADARMIVAERGDDGLVGFGLLDLEPNDADDPSVGTIGAVYVHPEHVREGIGRTILETLESIARDAGLETLGLTASKNAIGFYERQGYEGVETVALEMTDGVSLEALRMRKQLD
ncbi:GNAT family N-acetyltransferase [Natronolimnohabitans sp. A-GB9]|uniref:GNAT family N-acetyltransferase n=1 Tax=Natronolimnohabitans sp. A-GB9 TaxID=3069757 RepID=UPI0027AEC88C|nr:GNAT family N-acetyltransferase [Natronolimnohabitans sp. A-GB9]MDQ2051160.1 GNAT family N-acetyltransferase [Natronolimnohabitans sp. A-GB9]